MAKELPEGWLKTITEGYTAGYSDIEICKDLKITWKQFEKIYDGNDSFAELIDFGRMLSHAWWMSKARTNLNDRTFNTPLFIMKMKNTYGWSDKVEALNTTNNTESLEDMRAKLEREMPGLLKRLRPELQDSKIVEMFPDANG